jgi:hypothetical protein
LVLNIKPYIQLVRWRGCIATLSVIKMCDDNKEIHVIG